MSNFQQPRNSLLPILSYTPPKLYTGKEWYIGFYAFDPAHWKFIVFMAYCRMGYQSPLKNIPFHLEQSSILDLLEWKDKIYDQKISDMLFELGRMQSSIHEFMKPEDKKRRIVLMDATGVVLQSDNIPLARKGYNSNMDFQLQSVLLYLYDALTLESVYYRMLAGNIREVSAMRNTIVTSGMEDCVYIADKGFFSRATVTELERMSMQYIIPLRRGNKLIPYEAIKEMEQGDNNYFNFSERFIFYADTRKMEKRKIELFLDGKLKEQEKTDYLSRIQSLPESFTKPKFNEKVQTIGTLAIMHNTALPPPGTYTLNTRTGVRQSSFSTTSKNTINAACSHMQRQESLNGRSLSTMSAC
ncbi:MAG: transposase [Petrimonas sp.]|nr:transposase [Petrimonas sp.]